jgi:hypothetical protein
MCSISIYIEDRLKPCWQMKIANKIRTGGCLVHRVDKSSGKFSVHGYLDRLPAQSASHLVVYVGTYTHKEEGVSFFGFCFGVTESATAQHFLSRDPEREPLLTESAGRGDWYVTRNRKAEKMREEKQLVQLPDLLHWQIFSADSDQGQALIVRGKTLSRMHLDTDRVMFETEDAPSCVHRSNEMAMGGDTGDNLPKGIACDHDKITGRRFTATYHSGFPPPCWCNSP